MLKLLKAVLLLLVGAAGLAWAVSSYLDRQEPVYSVVIVSSLDEWKREMAAAGVNWEERFYAIREIKTVDITDAGTAGRCKPDNRPVIQIDYGVFRLGPYTAKACLWHELGHAFGLEHGSCEIMNDLLRQDEDSYLANWSAYKEEYIQALKNHQKYSNY